MIMNTHFNVVIWALICHDGVKAACSLWRCDLGIDMLCQPIRDPKASRNHNSPECRKLETSSFFILAVRCTGQLCGDLQLGFQWNGFRKMGFERDQDGVLRSGVWERWSLGRAIGFEREGDGLDIEIPRANRERGGEDRGLEMEIGRGTEQNRERWLEMEVARANIGSVGGRGVWKLWFQLISRKRFGKVYIWWVFLRKFNSDNPHRKCNSDLSQEKKKKKMTWQILNSKDFPAPNTWKKGAYAEKHTFSPGKLVTQTCPKRYLFFCGGNVSHFMRKLFCKEKRKMS